LTCDFNLYLREYNLEHEKSLFKFTEKEKLVFKKRKYFQLIKEKFTNIEKFDLIKVNRKNLVNFVNELKMKYIISKAQKRALIKKFIMKEKIDFPFNLSLEFSHKTYHKFRIEEKNIDRNLPLPEILIQYLKLLRKTKNFGKTNKKVIKEKIKNLELERKEYDKVYGVIKRAKSNFIKKKYEYDHFPPFDLYKYAHDKKIKHLPDSKKPVWKVRRGFHKKAISTGSGTVKEFFRKKHRYLFSKGLYSESLKNYFYVYLQDGIINKNNFFEFEKVMKECKKLDLVDNQTFKEIEEKLSLFKN